MRIRSETIKAQSAGPARLRKNERELLAAVAAGHVDLADARADHVAEQVQHLVSRHVSISIVDRFEIIHVQHDQREGEAVAPRAFELAPEARVEELAIVETGQPIRDRASLGLEKGRHLQNLRVSDLALQVLEVVEGGELERRLAPERLRELVTMLLERLPMCAGVGFLVVELGEEAQQCRMRIRRRAQDFLERGALVAIGRLEYSEQLLPGTPRCRQPWHRHLQTSPKLNKGYDFNTLGGAIVYRHNFTSTTSQILPKRVVGFKCRLSTTKARTDSRRRPSSDVPAVDRQ